MTELTSFQKTETSAIHLRRIVQLFLHPKQYFQDFMNLDRSRVYILAYFLGIMLIMDRIDTKMVKMQLSKEFGGVESIAFSWLYYWGFVLIFGLLSAWIAWHLYGWWYKVRLKWSGVIAPEPQLAKQVNVLQWTIVTLPIIVATIVQVFLYNNYFEAYVSDEIWSDIIALGFMVYSCVVSFIAAKTVFQVTRWGIFWFLVLPLLFYASIIIAMGIIFTSG